MSSSLASDMIVGHGSLRVTSNVQLTEKGLGRHYSRWGGGVKKPEGMAPLHEEDHLDP